MILTDYKQAYPQKSCITTAEHDDVENKVAAC